MHFMKNPLLIGLGALLGLSFLLISATNHYILTVGFFDNSGEYLSGIPSAENEVYESLQKYIYLSEAVFTFFKIGLIALVIYAALYLADHQVRYYKALEVVIFSEFVFLIPAAIKIIWFKAAYPHGTLADWHKIYILSALSFFDGVSANWFYPLQTLNMFEIAYWFLLALGIKRITRLDFDQSLRVVLLSYVPGLFVWVATVTFLTVMTFPGNI